MLRKYVKLLKKIQLFIDNNLGDEWQANNSEILLNFWSTNCANCILEIDELKTIHLEGRVRVIGIAIDGDEERVESLVRSKQISYPVLNGNEEVFLRFDGFSTPYSLVLDSELRVRKKISGRMDKTEFEAFVRTIEQQ